MALLFGVAFYLPARLYVERSAELNRGYRLAIYGLVAFGVLLGMSWILAKGAASFASALNGVAAAWLVFGFTPGSVTEPDARKLIWVVVAVLCGVLASRATSVAGFRHLVGIAAIVLVASPPIQLLGQLWERPDATISGYPTSVMNGGQNREAPDVWFVVLDGYPSGRTTTELFAGVDPLGPWLERKDFTVNANALTPYSRTKLALPALLAGKTLVGEGEDLGAADLAVLRSIVSGNNPLVHALKRAGYRITAVENGWHLSGCSDPVDQCVPPPLLDEQLSIVGEQFALGAALGVSPEDALGRGAQHTRAWLIEHANQLDDNGRVDATIIHLLAPHPPLRWSDDCEVEPDTHARSGLAVALPNTPPAVRGRRLRLFAEQLACVNRTARFLVDAVSIDSVMVFVGDHGIDSLGQFGTPTDEWDMDMIEERMLTLAALRLPSGCAEDIDLTIELVPRIVACLTDHEMNEVERKSFLPSLVDGDRGTSVIELDPETVDHLLGLGQ